jgi:hypothetical protein
MIWKIRLAVVLACLAMPACAIASQPGSLCSGPSASAQNQYCDDVPTATGGQGPSASSPTGAPPISRSLPASTRGALRAYTARRSRAVRRDLLKLPGRSVTTPLRGSGGADPLSLLIPLLLVLLAIAVVMGLEAGRRRRAAHAT